MHTSSPFKWRHYQAEIILLCVRWYLRYALSYRDLEEIMRERGLHIDHTTIYSWVYAIARSIRALPHAEQAESQLATESPTHQLALLEAKLRRARLPTNLIRHEHVFAQLDEGCLRTLTLISAPAGFGKTTLVCQWMAERHAHGELPPVAWVSLEAEDNDPLRFWRYVIVACQHLQAKSVESALDALQASTLPPFAPSSSIEEALTILLNTFTGVPGGILVLEDYHVIVEPQIHQTIAFLLDHLPESLHLFLITRADPPLSLARLRASGNLCEVRTANLRFSLQEIRLFLQQATPFPLSEDIIRHVNSRLDGWAAGLRLLSLSLQEQSSPQSVEYVLTTFMGSHRPLQAYFMSEVLALQPASVQAISIHFGGRQRLSLNNA